ncbi:Thylakoid lumenal 16.5 kDa protein, chloroplastic isoform C [Glycine soja]|nr:Thylakoid lumenal 16.5 kDa protein, chloroplastic isoform C [Glycine soja]
MPPQDLKNDWIRLHNPATLSSSKGSIKIAVVFEFCCPKKTRKIRKQNTKKDLEREKMATNILSTSNPFLLTNSFSSSSFVTPTYVYYNPIMKCTVKRELTLCKAANQPAPPHSPIVVTKRGLSISFITSFVLSLASKKNANAAILEADDDEELLEKVKRDRKKRLEKQGVISSSKQETGYLQDLVYKLSTVGQALEKNDLSAAGSVLGGNADADWVQRANIAFNKLSSSPEEKTEVDSFNSSLASLISSVN